MKMSEKIIKIREKLNINRSEFAKKINIDVAAVWRWEKEQRQPSNVALSSICKVFNVNSEWLIEGNLSADIFIDVSKQALDKLAQEFKLSECDLKFLKSYLATSTEKRNAINSVVNFD